jgi:hypothetical protein
MATILLGILPGLLLAAAPAPAAVEGEVHWDPDTPAGKEYAIPHEDARSLGETGTPSRGRGQRLFGAGIRHLRPRGAGRAATDESSRAGRGPGQDAQTEGPRARRSAIRSNTVQAEGPPPLLFATGGAGIVLLLGGAGIAVIRLLARRG